MKIYLNQRFKGPVANAAIRTIKEKDFKKIKEFYTGAQILHQQRDDWLLWFRLLMVPTLNCAGNTVYWWIFFSAITVISIDYLELSTMSLLLTMVGGYGSGWFLAKFYTNMVDTYRHLMLRVCIKHIVDQVGQTEEAGRFWVVFKK